MAPQIDYSDITGVLTISDIAAIILAGGKGERMKSSLPKVLHPLNGKPLIRYVLESLEVAGLDRSLVVVGYNGQMVIDELGESAEYVWQHEQLGTGHAVMQAEEKLEGFNGRVIVACGDVPLIKPETFKSLISEFENDSVKAVVLTMKPESPTGYGRIVKDEAGRFLKIVEEKDAMEEEKLIEEVNSGTYIFDKEFLFTGLKKVDRNNAQGEYYLPDVLNHVLDSGYIVNTLLLENAVEGSGINSKEELVYIEDNIKKGRVI